MTEKEKFLRKFNRAFADSDIAYLTDNITENITWNIPGDQHIQGKEAFVRALKEMAGKEKFKLDIAHVITHGRTASVNGVISSRKGASYAFCDVYVFSGFKNPKVSEITSYVIALKE